MGWNDKQIRAVNVGPIAISDESFDCIRDTIGYSIGYWASSADWNDEARTVTITENDEDEEGVGEQHTLSYDKIHETFWGIVTPDSKFKLNKTVSRYFINSVLDGAGEGQGDIDAGHIDGDAADALIQLAIFGEITYG